ncbi:MAG: phosphomannomutase/phosphoglucomutase [Candidatus Magasanikbacteria bacterium CG10_big_fil_rev_8_21_14_0_10_47_10]|uniref:Phosphomannomutase/phosphoglucomutase n=1 Tax=Candidatus Magasanikbacteria bacterium CG10_big_fil_rev_8_21_14_0_10_47_10 TaxID=1974652 RepID=A0A2H0TQL9_9BACT|nr:MAG: phosphomannomutase/phosphoglucomutase [Candidatus Magasanikbacteria bacterium CG10_big_fil_rev_8_21_14_0_10_47_10]
MLDQSIFRSYDVRGEFGSELTEEAAYIIAHAYAEFTGAKRVVVGMDVRTSSPVLMGAVVRGLLERGCDVIDIGMVSTDVSYFSAWKYAFDGSIMVTASHMPKQFNGLKFLYVNAEGILVPIGKGLGMEQLRDLANRPDIVRDVKKQGTLTGKDVWDDYVAFVRSFVDIGAIKPLHVVMDAGNGMGGLVAEKVFSGLPLVRADMNFEPDGRFPHHSPNPIVPKNRADIIAKVKEVGADLGIAWDADCDRCYFIDEKGTFINGDFITALLGKYFVQRNPGASIVYDAVSNRGVRHAVEAAGGIAYMERVGHVYIKHKMREIHAVFGGETSGHYYFAENHHMDNGFIPALIVMQMMSVTDKSLSALIGELGEYHVSGEINYIVEDVDAIYARLKESFSDGKVTTIDGLSIDYPEWHFNVRPSATDPVIRLNVEATSPTMVRDKVALVSEIIGADQVEDD